MSVILMFVRKWVGGGPTKRLPEHSASTRVSPLHGPHRSWGAHRKTKIADLQTNRLVIHIQPDEGITLRFAANVAGSIMRLGLVSMEFDYTRDFRWSHSTGYERLNYDCMMGDATLFQRADMVEAGWKVIQPVLDAWKGLPSERFPNYAAGSWGPAAADELLARDARAWRTFEEEKLPSEASEVPARVGKVTAGVH